MQKRSSRRPTDSRSWSFKNILLRALGSEVGAVLLIAAAWVLHVMSQIGTFLGHDLRNWARVHTYHHFCLHAGTNVTHS
jgi:hypothetical protein